MADESFLLVDLKDEKSKKLAQVISNETSRKILDFLAKKDATESELAKELGVPLSTVHYNLKHLSKAGLIQVDEFHYSEKGKEVNHYKLSNKLIIIAPQPAKESFLNKLKKILPVALIVGGAAAMIQMMAKLSPFASKTIQTVTDKFPVITDKVTQIAVPIAGKMKDIDYNMYYNDVVEGFNQTAMAGAPAVADEVASESLRMMPTVTQEVVNQTVSTTTIETINVTQPLWQSIALWFVIGAVFGLIIYFLWNKILKKK
ncbi:ArsR/SmtB family transcription factor [Nanoarchaeota archaeon]